jgi:hypothetical protein
VAAAAAGFGLIAFFTGQDDATTATRPAAAPGVAVPAQAGRDAKVLRAGNVILLAGREQVAGARRLAEELAGPPSRALRDAGQAVLVEERPGRGGIVAVAWERRLEARTPDDPALREFVEHWLGRGT